MFAAALVMALLSSAMAAAQGTQDAATTLPAGSALNAVTYEQVLQMLSLGIDEEAILKRLARSPTVFTLDARQVEALKQAGASDKLLTAMAGQRAGGAQSGDVTDLAIILDCSGSMKELTTGREAKMAVAKRVVADLVQKIPEGLNVTLVIYGHEVYGGAEDPRNCQAVKVARPLAPLDASGKLELAQMIARLQPTGATPIALSLKTAGQELAKNKSLCGLVLITDGLETCHGDPAAEAAMLVANLKVTFGVNVVGFGVKPEENVALKAIADAGKGKYYAAQDAKALTDSISAIAQEIQAKAKPAEVVDTSRRAIRVLKPQVELPEMRDIYMVPEAEAEHAVRTKIGSINKYDDYLRVPSATNKYAVIWEPREGIGVFLLRDFSIPERRVVDVRPESILGLIQVSGMGKVDEIYVVRAGERSAVVRKIQNAKKYDQIMVVPAGKYDVYVDRSRIEEDLDVEPGKLHRLQ
jgi:Mg-chelatase subunit ChlD